MTDVAFALPCHNYSGRKTGADVVGSYPISCRQHWRMQAPEVIRQHAGAFPPAWNQQMEPQGLSHCA